MKVTIPEITDKELAELLKSSGMNDDEVKSFLKRCEDTRNNRQGTCRTP